MHHTVFVRFTMSAINTAAGLMPPPPPPVAVPPPNGEVVPGGREHSKHLMPPPSSRPEKHRSSPSGLFYGISRPFCKQGFHIGSDHINKTETTES